MPKRRGINATFRSHATVWRGGNSTKRKAAVGWGGKTPRKFQERREGQKEEALDQVLATRNHYLNQSRRNDIQIMCCAYIIYAGQCTCSCSGTVKERKREQGRQRRDHDPRQVSQRMRHPRR